MPPPTATCTPHIPHRAPTRPHPRHHHTASTSHQSPPPEHDAGEEVHRAQPPDAQRSTRVREDAQLAHDERSPKTLHTRAERLLQVHHGEVCKIWHTGNRLEHKATKPRSLGQVRARSRLTVECPPMRTRGAACSPWCARQQADAVTSRHRSSMFAVTTATVSTSSSPPSCIKRSDFVSVSVV